MNPRVVLLDDDPDNLTALEQMLHAIEETGVADVHRFTSAVEALAWCQAHEPDLCLVDYCMPQMDGIAFLAAARGLPGFKGIPMILVTDLAERDVRHQALVSGATDFLTRPVHPADMKARVTNLLRLRMGLVNPRAKVERLMHDVEDVSRDAIEREHEQIILKLSQLSRCRDEETGNHMRRVAHVAQLLAQELGFDSGFCDTLFLAAPLHDIGKVGIPDRILLKPGKLTPEEWGIMKTHTAIGYEVLKDSSSQLLRMGAAIARSHHEKFDGSGYPFGLAGEDIPVVGRIVAVADELDALLSVRPYKQAWAEQDALALVKSKRGTQFDPLCIDVLFQHIDAVLEIQRKFADPAFGPEQIYKPLAEDAA